MIKQLQVVAAAEPVVPGEEAAEIEADLVVVVTNITPGLVVSGLLWVTMALYPVAVLLNLPGSSSMWRLVPQQ